MEIEIHKRCVTHYVPDCHIRYHSLVDLWHYDQQHFDNRYQYRSTALFDNDVVFDFHKQEAEAARVVGKRIYNFGIRIAEFKKWNADKREKKRLPLLSAFH